MNDKRGAPAFHGFAQERDSLQARESTWRVTSAHKSPAQKTSVFPRRLILVGEAFSPCGPDRLRRRRSDDHDVR